MQLELFAWDFLNAADRLLIYGCIRNAYWHIRNLRGAEWGQAARRRHYRRIAHEKKRLQLAGVSKREILDFLACCRLQCKARKQPFKFCKYCSQSG
jgi:hypothetical protein